MNAGVELQDLDTTFDTWLQSRSTVNLQSWSSNINTLLSICRLLGIDLPARRGPNPQIWSLASIACMEIGANNSDPPSQLGIQLLPKLIEHGSYLVDSTARLRQTIFNAPTGAEVLFAFLIKKYEAAVNDVITAVEETHAKKLALAHVDSPNLKALPEFLELLAEAESVAGLVFDDTLIVTAADNRLLPWKVATPSSEHNAIMPLPRHARGEQPVGTEEGWMGSRLDDLVPSVYDCKSWPTVSGAEAWKAFPLEVSAHAIAGSWLGLGKVSIEYQAQIEQWYWEGDSLLGIPIVYYILLLSSTQRRTAISAASRYIADSHLGPIRCFASGSLLKVGTIGLKQNFDRSRGTVALLPTESYENFIRPNQLFDEVRSCYATIASQIWEEFSDDLSSTVSNLGCRVAMLDRVTGLIRIVAQWLVPDRVATDARLRASLYDRAHLLTPRSPGVTLANALKKDPDLIVPLLDSQILINMILLREGQEKHDAEAWSTDQLLGSLADWRDASSSALVRSVRIRHAADLEGSAVPHIANLVEELRLHQRYFPVPS